jgi:hypothetical protein
MTHVKVIPAYSHGLVRGSGVLGPGPNVDRAKLFGVSVERCRSSRAGGWTRYIYSHPVLGESKDAYESAEDCADAALLLLAKALTFEFDSAVVKRDDLLDCRESFRRAGLTDRADRMSALIEESLNPLNKNNGGR